MKKMNEQILADYAQSLLGIDSPTGFTRHAIAWIEEQVQALGYTCYRNAKGNLIVEIEGPADQPVVAVSAHTDTLGLMVRSIKKDGKLAFTRLGGPCLPTLDGEYCRIITRQGKVYTGTILSTAPAVHVYKE
ncbi:MAG: aminopeptidase, partial [Holdemania filiformis]